MMKKIIGITFLLLVAINVSAQEINWITLEEAIALQKKEPKKILMDVYTKWCGPCKMLDRNTFSNPDVANYINEHYYAVKFNGEGNATVTYKGKTYSNPNYDPAKANRRNSAHELTRYLSVRAYPTVVYFDEDANVIAPISGYLVPRQIELYLKLFKTDDYKNVNTAEAWKTYQETFKSEFNRTK